MNEQKDFARDKGSRALINTNEKAFLQYKKVKERNARLEKLEDDVSEIKSLLKQLLHKE